MKTVLIVEDNLEIRENISEILELNGYSIVSAVNGSEGIEYAKKMKPDIILCDIMMPGVNGYDVLKELKKDDITSKIPFIYVTASAEKSEEKMGMEMGADGYVRKPFYTLELIDIINKFLDKKI